MAQSPSKNNPGPLMIDGHEIHSCKHCQLLVLDMYKKTPLTGDLQQLFNRRKLSAEILGCPLFAYIDGILDINAAEHNKGLIEGFVAWYKKTLKWKSSNAFLKLSNERLLYGEDRSDFLRLYVTAIQGSPSAKHILRRPRSACVLSGDLSRMLSEWLTECHSSHPELCRVREIADRAEEFVPTRLVEISGHGDQISAKLVETCGQGVKRWCSLSYCWGGDQPLKTDKMNYTRYLNGMPCDNLPRTLRDAMTVTIALGLRHIWIDSLCIIQDDGDDVATELSHMPMIYERAWVTVAASSAASCSQGFLANYAAYDQNLCALQYNNGSTQFGSVLLAHSTGTNTSIQFDKDPITSRAWTLQEHLLSPRLIEFSNHQVRWRCAETQGYTGNPVFSEGVGQDHLLNILELRKKGTKKALVQAWNKIAEGYSKRHLTIPSDRLNAISSLARRFTGLGLDKYCAGLWQNTLPYSLCWGVTSPGERYLQYVCPTWSWLSVSCTARDGRPNILLYLSPTGDGRPVSIQDARIEGIEQVLATRDANYGTLKEASLIINGHILPVHSEKKAEGPFYTLYAEGVTTSLRTRMT